MTARIQASVRWTAITAAFVNLAIHLVLVPMHLAEMLYIGVLFVIGSGLLGMVMVGLASDRDRLRTSAWVGGTLVSAVESVLFVLSRTTGLPGGYHETWATSTEDLLGLTSLAVEVVFIACAVVSVARDPHPLAAGTSNSRMPLHDRTAPLA